MKSLACLTIVLAATGIVLAIAGVVYALAMGAGIPTQDASTERQAYEVLHNQLGSIVSLSGVLIHLGGWIVGIYAITRPWQRRRMMAVKSFEVVQ